MRRKTYLNWLKSEVLGLLINASLVVSKNVVQVGISET